jgi:periplasmic protein TonB
MQTLPRIISFIDYCPYTRRAPGMRRETLLWLVFFIDYCSLIRRELGVRRETRHVTAMNPQSQSSQLEFLDDRPSRFVIALIVAAAIECGAVIGITVVQQPEKPPPGHHGDPVRMSIEAPPPPPQPVTPPSPPPPPPPPQPVTPPPPPPPPPPQALPSPPLPLPPPPPKPQPEHRRISRPVPRPVPQVVAQPRPETPQQPNPQPPAPKPQMASGDEISAFADACRRAVQAALIYPDFARMNGEQGVVGIRFRYHDGVASDIQVVRSSGHPALDAAAKSTVRQAQLPPPTKDLASATVTIDVNVVFHMS